VASTTARTPAPHAKPPRIATSRRDRSDGRPGLRAWLHCRRHVGNRARRQDARPQKRVALVQTIFH
jgi:hypothetical protein